MVLAGLVAVGLALAYGPRASLGVGTPEAGVSAGLAGTPHDEVAALLGLTPEELITQSLVRAMLQRAMGPVAGFVYGQAYGRRTGQPVAPGIPQGPGYPACPYSPQGGALVLLVPGGAGEQGEVG